MAYIHELKNWPHFTWKAEAFLEQLNETRQKQARLLWGMNALGFPIRAEAGLETLTIEAVKSCAIEGENLDPAQVRSSLALRLGLPRGGASTGGRAVEGLAEMMLDATRNFAEPLSAERLWGWQAALFPTGYSGLRKISVGSWRGPEAGPMQVVSGPIGRENVHFEAPAADRLEIEMKTFLEWFNGRSEADPLIKAGIAHIWFVTIHPFEDGNGRIARAIADCALARADGCPDRFYSMSAQIERERKNYYSVLEASQRGPLDITPWLQWFMGCLGRAIDQAEDMLSGVMQRAHYWQLASQFPLNQRQLQILPRLVDGLEGKLTSGKYAKLAKCSTDTALRDLQKLVEFGLLAHGEGGGRSRCYVLSKGKEGGQG